MDALAVQGLLRRLGEEGRVFDVPRVPAGTSPASWYREFVAASKPCILMGLAKDWQAVQQWDSKGLLERLQDREVRVAVTPDGRADAVRRVTVGGEERGVFMLPEERRMPFRELLQRLEQEGEGTEEVCYAQAQNGSFSDDFSALSEDCSDSVAAFGREAFGCEKAEAVNFWFGGERSISSLHRDHYENLYVVCRGVKRFTLMPPWEIWCTHYTDYPVGRWTRQDGSWKAELDGGRVPWCSADPHDGTGTWPRMEDSHPLTVDVRPGEVLYIPCGWLHRVAQGPLTAAVNYWFEGKVGPVQLLTDTAVRLARCLDNRDALSDADE